MPEVAVEEQVSSVVENAQDTGDATLMASDLLVEDVSIDGMCGVY